MRRLTAPMASPQRLVGQVVGPDGRGVAGVGVTFEVRGQPAPVARATSGPNGRVDVTAELPGDARGPWPVFARAEGQVGAGMTQVEPGRAFALNAEPISGLRETVGAQEPFGRRYSALRQQSTPFDAQTARARQMFERAREDRAREAMPSRPERKPLGDSHRHSPTDLTSPGTSIDTVQPVRESAWMQPTLLRATRDGDSPRQPASVVTRFSPALGRATDPVGTSALLRYPVLESLVTARATPAAI